MPPEVRTEALQLEGSTTRLAGAVAQVKDLTEIAHLTLPLTVPSPALLESILTATYLPPAVMDGLETLAIEREAQSPGVTVDRYELMVLERDQLYAGEVTPIIGYHGTEVGSREVITVPTPEGELILTEHTITADGVVGDEVIIKDLEGTFRVGQSEEEKNDDSKILVIVAGSGTMRFFDLAESVEGTDGESVVVMGINRDVNTGDLFTVPKHTLWAFTALDGSEVVVREVARASEREEVPIKGIGLNSDGTTSYYLKDFIPGRESTGERHQSEYEDGSEETRVTRPTALLDTTVLQPVFPVVESRDYPPAVPDLDTEGAYHPSVDTGISLDWPKLTPDKAEEQKAKGIIAGVVNEELAGGAIRRQRTYFTEGILPDHIPAVPHTAEETLSGRVEDEVIEDFVRTSRVIDVFAIPQEDLPRIAAELPWLTPNSTTFGLSEIVAGRVGMRIKPDGEMEHFVTNDDIDYALFEHGLDTVRVASLPEEPLSLLDTDRINRIHGHVNDKPVRANILLAGEGAEIVLRTRRYTSQESIAQTP